MESEKDKLLKSVKIPLILVIAMWLVAIVEAILKTDFGMYGIKPLTVSGLAGIFLAPFIHGGWQHLMSNTPGIFVLGVMMNYFYPSVSKISMIFILLLSGIGVWLFARNSYHIGASGLVYGFAFFIFFSAIFRNDMRSMAISFFIILFYGGIIWGMLPLDNKVSFESHISGALSGIILAYWGRKSDIVPKPVSEETIEYNMPSYREVNEGKDRLKE
jgi:membrane associated rhomboid family serine protease